MLRTSISAMNMFSLERPLAAAMLDPAGGLLHHTLNIQLNLPQRSRHDESCTQASHRTAANNPLLDGRPRFPVARHTSKYRGRRAAKAGRRERKAREAALAAAYAHDAEAYADA